MGSILADIESNFEPVTEQELKKIGFHWHYMRENAMFTERIIDTMLVTV